VFFGFGVRIFAFAHPPCYLVNSFEVTAPAFLRLSIFALRMPTSLGEVFEARHVERWEAVFDDVAGCIGDVQLSIY